MSVAAAATGRFKLHRSGTWSSPRFVPLRWSLANRLGALVPIDMPPLTELEPPAVRKNACKVQAPVSPGAGHPRPHKTDAISRPAEQTGCGRPAPFRRRPAQP